MVSEILMGGVWALQDYVATHVLTCLVPAFFLAGGMVTFINREAVLIYLGEQANRIKSFSVAGGSSFFLAACSCTVIPVASGLYYAGAGVGVAFILLWVAPAANILALIYTGNILGGAMVISRVVAALGMAFVVGAVMTVVFGHEVRERMAAPKPVAAGNPNPAANRLISREHLILLFLILLSLLLPNYLIQTASYGWKVLVWAMLSLVAAGYAVRVMSKSSIMDWMRETWFFVRIIFPLLLLGVFLVGVIGKVLPEAWIQTWLGGNGLLASFLATLIGAVSYFATMTEAPFVDTLMGLGMGKGPALALLLAGPGISLPNWLAIARVFGLKKALVYVPTVVVLATVVGFLFGNFIL
jgi:uncharacterized protein